MDVVSNSAQRKHLYPDCEDRFQAEKISNRERRDEQETFKNTIFKLKNIPENFEKLEKSGIKYLRSKEFVEYWTFRRDDCSKPFTLCEAGQMRPSFQMKWDKYCHLEAAISEKRDVMWPRALQHGSRRGHSPEVQQEEDAALLRGGDVSRRFRCEPSREVTQHLGGAVSPPQA